MFGVAGLKEPTKTPDLNPIQHLWDELKQESVSQAESVADISCVVMF